MLLVVGIVVGLNIRWFRHRLARLLHGASDASSAAQGSFAAMSVPVVILTGGSVAWYNDCLLYTSPLSAVLFLRYHPGADGNGRKVTRDQATF